MITVKLTISIAVVASLLVVVWGCAHEQFPRVNPGRVTGFSSGSAKAPVFKSEPTAKQLHSALLKLYDSFDSCAASGMSTSDGPTVSAKPEANSFELRYQKPDKHLSMVGGRYGSVMVTDGKRGIWYWPDSNEYTDRFVRLEKAEAESDLTGVGLPRNAGSSILSLRLLPKKIINNVDVYVLEIRLAAVSYGHTRLLNRTFTIYVGKADLLPRKTVLLRDEERDGKAVRSVYTRVFSGFRANVELPEGLFSTTPPRGAKR